jgi:cation:H+ antiporter
MPVLELIAGLALLLAGGEGLVRGSVALATRLGVSPLIIGLTLVGFGTSMPELVASVEAALIGAPGIAVGNVVGSNIANVLLVIGASAVILPVTASVTALKRDGSVMLLVTALMVAIVVYGALGRWMGLALVGLLLVYTVGSFLKDMRADNGATMTEELPTWPRSLPVALVLTVAGIGGVVIGADLLVRAAISIAEIAGLSEAVIGLTVVAIGTSLPELATSVVAALRRHGDVALGNVIGSNIFNILGIAGVTAVVTPITIPAEIMRLDVWVMTAAAVVLIAFGATSRGVGRVEGVILLAAYAGYLALQFSPAARGALGL